MTRYLLFCIVVAVILAGCAFRDVESREATAAAIEKVASSVAGIAAASQAAGNPYGLPVAGGATALGLVLAAVVRVWWVKK